MSDVLQEVQVCARTEPIRNGGEALQMTSYLKPRMSSKRCAWPYIPAFSWMSADKNVK